jgi:hypothetical protein
VCLLQLWIKGNDLEKIVEKRSVLQNVMIGIYGTNFAMVGCSFNKQWLLFNDRITLP